MPSNGSVAGVDEIHAYLVDQLNSALRRPSMFSQGDAALRMLVDHLLFVECRPEVWAEEQRAWVSRGARTSTGVAGMFQELMPGGCDQYYVASVYAEFAHRRGWLRPDRLLPTGEHHALRARVRRWVQADRSWADVTSEFGPPSILCGGTNPLYGKALGYLGEDPAESMVFFHLWNGSTPAPESTWPELEEPVLLAARFGDAPFDEAFIFTPEGRRRRPEPDSLFR
ncbi:hypothetical protein [Streptomyces iconiensis]|uniref:Uncharacterized protein n=1 Tax=Streptomyces iconiensis TaxID=1384038 RepID=A0ABT7A185_9ACTN|nr:hypothetical protein [Streptomyces iconiensis]MDJ1135076.1 hypothetical protein [Streptomyces iconiensis]